MSTQIAAGHVLIGAQVAPALAGLGKVQAGMTATAARGGKMSTALVAASKGAAIGLGLMAVGAVKAAQAAGDFQAALNEMRAVSGATSDEMKAVSKSALQLGADAKLPGTSARDAALAMTELAKGGLSAKQAMDAARGTLMLAAAAGVDNAQAATIQADALNAFGLKARDASRVADLLAASANASTSEIGDMALALKASSAVAHQAGMPIEDVVTALSNLANAGIKGSDAGTSLKTMLLRLMAPVGAGANAIKALNLNLRDQEGRLKTIPALAQEFANKTKGLNRAQRDAAMAAIFGSDAIRAGNILLGKGVGAHEKMKKKVTEQGAAQQLAAAKMAGFNGAMDALSSAVDTLAIQLGTALLPSFTAIVNAASAAVGWMSANAGTMKVLAGIAASLGTAILLVAGYLKAMAVAQAILNAVMLANPIVLVAAAIAGLAAGLVIAYKNSATFRAVVDGAFKAVATAAKTLVSAFQAVLSWVQGNWRTIATLIAGPFAPLVALATDAFGIRSALIGAFNATVSAVKSAMSKAVGAVKGAVGAAKGAATAVGKAVVDGVTSGIQALAQLGGQLIEYVASAVVSAGAAAYSLAISIGARLVSGVVSGLSGLASAVANKISGALSSALGSIDIPGLSPPEHAAMEAIGKPLIKGAVKGIKQEQPKLAAALSAAVRDAIRTAKGNAADLAGGLSGMIGTGVDALTGARLAGLGNSPEAQRLRDIIAQQKAAQTARERAGLEEAIRTSANAKDRRKAEDDLNDWLLDQERQRIEDSLQAQTDAINDEAEARKKAADQGIRDLTRMFNEGKINAAQYNAQLQQMIAGSVGDYRNLGGLLGYDFVQGFAAQLGALVQQIGAIAGGPGGGTGVGMPGPDVFNPATTANAEQRQRLATALTTARDKLETAQGILAKRQKDLSDANADARKQSGPGGTSITSAEATKIAQAQAAVNQQKDVVNTWTLRAAEAQRNLQEWNAAHRGALGGVVQGAGRTDKVPTLLAPGEGVLNHRRMDQMLDMAMGGGGRSAAAAPPVNVNFYGPVIGGGDRRALARELADMVAPELNRRISIRA